MDNSKKKVIVGFSLLPVAIWLLGFAPPALLLIVVLVLAAGVGAHEMGRMAFKDGGAFEKTLLVIMSLFICLATQSGEMEMTALALCIAFIITAAAILFHEKDLARVWTTLGVVFGAAFYVGFLSGLVVALRRLEPAVGGSKLTLILFALTWANDAGAFFVGSRFGKKKLWPEVSAGKTWEGFYGGVAGSILLAFIVAWISPVWQWHDALVLGLLFGFVTPMGDLIESALKRGAGVKDSGVFLPGHGGVLDRIDSILFTVPIMYFYALTVGLGRLSGLAL